jgi:DNA excision repair protein ERCC-3
MPCGSGKTLVGLGIMVRLGQPTIIFATSTTAAKQWMDSALDMTTLKPEQVFLFTSDREEKVIAFL